LRRFTSHSFMVSSDVDPSFSCRPLVECHLPLWSSAQEPSDPQAGMKMCKGTYYIDCVLPYLFHKNHVCFPSPHSAQSNFYLHRLFIYPSDPLARQVLPMTDREQNKGKKEGKFSCARPKPNLVRPAQGVVSNGRSQGLPQPSLANTPLGTIEGLPHFRAADY
jgi:hypothetical protein